MKGNKKKALAALVAMASAILPGTSEAALSAQDFKDMIQAEKITVSYYDTTNINYSKDDATTGVTTVDFSDKDGTNRRLTGIVTNATDGSSAATVSYVAEATATLQAYSDANLAKANSYTDSKFKESQTYADGIGAMSAAMASIPAPQYGGKGQTAWGIGVGNFHSKTAVAAGISHDITDNVRAQVKAAMYSGESMVGVGIGGSFGKPKRAAVQQPMPDMTNYPPQIRTIRTATNNYTNMYGHSFVVKETNGVLTLYNLDGKPYTEAQMDKFAEDFMYNNGHDFTMSGFRKNPNGNYQYYDEELGQWLGGSEQSAVGSETITIEKARPMTQSERALYAPDSSSTPDAKASATGHSSLGRADAKSSESVERSTLGQPDAKSSAPRKADGSVDFDEIERQIREEARTSD